MRGDALVFLSNRSCLYFLFQLYNQMIAVLMVIRITFIATSTCATGPAQSSIRTV